MDKRYFQFIWPLVFLLVSFTAEAAAPTSLDQFLDEVVPEQQGPGEPENLTLDGITSRDQEEFEKLLDKVIGVSLFEEKEEAPGNVLRYMWKTFSEKHVFRVYATSFGKPGNKGENKRFKDGSRVRWGVVAVALPDPSAIGKWVEVRLVRKNGGKTRWIKMKVKDLGPWFRDDPYWKKSGSPRAVKYFKKKKKRFDGRVVVNPAGIDITPWGWQRLGIKPQKSYNHSQHVEWRFGG